MAVMLLKLALCAVLLTSSLVAARMRPVVLLHGLFANYEAMSHIEGWLHEDYPGIYVHNADIPIQNNSNGKYDSLVIPMEQQVADLAAQLNADPNLSEGFDLICHSQGGLTCRAYIEKYNSPRVHNYISLAGPHMGVFGVPDFNAICPDVDCPWIADWFANASYGPLEDFMQKDISFAQYWKSPFLYEKYLSASAYLPDVNNERAVKNATYKENLVGMSGNLTLVMALLDEIVIPKESEWFGFYALGQDVEVLPMEQQPLYTEDWLGIRTLNEAGRLERLAVNCTHVQLPRIGCRGPVYEDIIRPRVAGTLP